MATRKSGKTSVRSRRDGHPKWDGKASLPEVEALHRAADQCQSAFTYSATTDGIKEPARLLCLVDCAQMCRLTADLILRNGTYVHQMRDLCMQQLCDAVETCKRYPEDEVLAACVDVLEDAVDALAHGSGAEAE